MALTLLPLVLIPVMIMGGAAYLRARTLLQDQAADRLNSASQAQFEALQEWASEREQRIQLAAQRTAVREGLQELLRLPESDQIGAPPHSTLISELEEVREREGEILFSEILIARLTDGRILTATEPEWEGIQLASLSLGAIPAQTLQSTPVFGEPLFGPSEFAFLTTIPLHVEFGGQTVDTVLLGVNRDLELGKLLEQMQVFVERRGAYRVERGQTFFALAPDIIVDLPRYSMVPESTSGIDHPIFDIAQTNPSGTSQFTTPDGEDVLASYQWVPEWNLGVVVQIPREDVFAEIATLAPFTLGLIVAVSVLTFIIIAFATNRMMRPLENLTDFAEQMAKGEWHYRVPEERDDEIGILASSLNRMADELSSVYRSLEERVEARTNQIRIAAEISRAAISSPSLEDLMRRAVELIHERFGFYHVSIYLLDQERQAVALVEASGEIGEALKARGLQIEIGSATIIGWAAQHKQPRLSADVSQDPLHQPNELLPLTKSELAIPLQVAGQILGVLDIQSSETAAFEPEDVEALRTLADQLSAAIHNASMAMTSVTAADRARFVSEVTRELTGLQDIDEILQRTAQSLHRALGQSEIIVKLNTTDAGLQVSPPDIETETEL
jgi:putative methionine-R-sulfoxide reductase with GAF domain